jgi:hypothetical protein
MNSSDTQQEAESSFDESANERTFYHIYYVCGINSF